MRFLWLFLLLSWSISAFAALRTTTDVAQILDEPEIVQVGDEADIRINFTAPVNYLRHFPDGPSDVLRITFDIPDPCLAEQLRIQESKNSPKGNLITPFVVTFPEVIAVTNRGKALCRATGNRVETNETLLIKFDTVNTYKVRLGEDNHSVIIRVPLRSEPVTTFVQPKLTVAMPPENATAEQLMKSGRAAMKAGEYETAVQIFNRLLNLPPSEFSQEAQELVGVARESNGDFTKAKVEYELYLKLYPQSIGALRVKERLVAINEGKAKVAENKVSSQKIVRQIDQKSMFGSLSQYYYGGRTLTNTNAAGIKTNTRNTDQSALVTSIDTSARWRHNQYDEKIVFRDAETHNFPPGDNFRDINRLNAAYWDHEDKSLGYSLRLGRQPGNSQGILGRFDGGLAKYIISDKFRIAGVAGVPDNGSHSPIRTNRQFYGTALEFGAPSDSFSGNVYAIQQNADGITERRAVGSELRYFNNASSWFGLMDYDTIYDRVNIATLQGNWTTSNQVTYNMLIDHRNSPILYAETAIPTVAGVVSVSGLQKLLSKKDIISAVNKITADTDSALFGATKQFTPKWQLGGDIRYVHTSGTKGSGLVLATPSTGPTYTYSIQAIGNNAVFSDDTSIINASYVDDQDYYAEMLGLTNVATFRSKWRVTSSLNFYNEKRDLGQRTFKASPTVRLSYQMHDNMLLESELGFERSYVNDNALDTKTKSTREYMFVGYRWDF